MRAFLLRGLGVAVLVALVPSASGASFFERLGLFRRSGGTTSGVPALTLSEEQVVTGLKEALVQRGPEGTAAWCREAAADLAVIDAEWTTQGEELAYLRAVVSSRQTARTEWKVALLRRPDGWAVSDRRLVR